MQVVYCRGALYQMDKLETKLVHGDWSEVLKDFLTPIELYALSKFPKTSVLSAPLLEEAIGASRARKVIRESGILPEINTNGERRCTYVLNGKRCKKYNNIPVCDTHFDRACMLSNHFKSASLRKEYERLMNSPYKMHLDSELAMMRLMLGVLVGKINDGGVSMEHVVAITQMSEKIAGVVDKMSKMNAVTPETVDKLMNGVVQIIAQYVPADQLPQISAEIAKINPKVNSCDVPYEPGDKIGDEMVEAIPMHKRALLEIAAQMKEVDGEVV